MTKIINFTLTIIFLSFSITILAQSNGFTTLQESVLTDNQQTTKERLEELIHSSGMSVGTFNNVGSAFGNDGSLNLSFPGSNCGLINFKPQNINFLNENNFEWYGSFEDYSNVSTCDCSRGNLLLLGREGSIYGNAQVDNKNYLIADLGEGVNAIGEVNTNGDMESTYCALPSDENEEGENQIMTHGEEFEPLYSSNRNHADCVVRILVLFDQSVLDDVNGSLLQINNAAHTSFTELQMALLNSDVQRSDLSVILAGVEFMDFNSNSLNLIQILTDFTNDTGVQQLRDNFDADIVMLFTSEDLGFSGGIAGGQLSDDGSTIESALGNPQAHLAFGILDFGVLFGGQFTFCHEVGHIFGARHQDCGLFQREILGRNGCSQDLFPPTHGHSWGHYDGWCITKRYTDYRSIMHQVNFPDELDFTPGVLHPVLHFSNPEVNYLSEPTGFSPQSDVASWLRATACTVANFEDDDDINSTSVIIHGLNELCEGYEENYNAQVTPFGGSFSYIWEVSTNGINNWVLISSGSSSSVNVLADYPAGTSFFLRVRVTNQQNGQTAYNVKQIDVIIASQNICNRSIGSSAGTPNLDFALFPNPSTSNFIEISYSNLDVHFDESRYKIEIFDVSGKVVLTSDIDFKIENRVYFDNLVNGVYLVQISSDKFSTVLKFIKNE